MSNDHTVLIAALGVCAAFAASSVVAQDAQAPATAYGVLQEVVVTAQKRTETILSVPISITALSQDALDRQGIHNLDDVARATPALVITSNNSLGYSNVSIRGIVSGTGAATTGTYIDDSPIQERNDSLSPPIAPLVFDLERVEVLRGPQGTLFGAGSEGGTLRFITPAPSLTASSLRVKAESAFTEKGAPSYEAGVAGGAPIVDGTLGFRASAWYRNEGGYVDRVSRTTRQLLDSNSNSTTARAARVALAWRPIDALTITPAVYYQQYDIHDSDLYWESAPRFQSEARNKQPNDDKWTLATLTAEYQAPVFSIKSITSYLSHTNSLISDWTYIEAAQLQGGPVDVPGLPDWSAAMHARIAQNVWTQELRFTSADDPDARLSWVGGLYFQHNQLHRVRSEFEDLDALTGAIFGAPAVAIFGVPSLPGPVGYAENTTTLEQETAAFGNLSYKLSESLKLTLGARVARTRFSSDNFQDGPWNGGPSRAQGTEAETPVTPKANLTYNFTHDQMVYVTAAQGYRTGGGNQSFAGNPVCQTDLHTMGVTDAPSTYRSDSLWSYEVGTKNRLLGGRLELSASAFRIDWKNIQSLIFLPTCGFVYSDNLGKAVSQGGDFELHAQLAPGLTFNLSMGYTDAHYAQTTTLPSGVTVAKDGDPLPIPKLTGSTSLDFDHEIFDTGHIGYVNVTYDFAGRYQRNPGDGVFGADPTVRDADAVKSMSLRLGARFSDFDVSAFVDNAFNSTSELLRYHEVVASTTYRLRTLRPRTIGVTGSYSF